MLLAEERAAIADHCRRLRPDGLVVGTSGNLSVRSGDLIAITPTGLDYAEVTPEAVGVHRLDGSPVEAPYEPTSEMPMHLAVYAHTDAGAVVHTHSTAATAVSTLLDEVPPIHYLLARFGTAVRVAPYATYGTEELARNMLSALAGSTACLLANHGTVVYGSRLGEAYEGAVYLEWLCDLYLRARQAGSPALLPPEEIARVHEKLSMYGARAREEGAQTPSSPQHL